MNRSAGHWLVLGAILALELVLVLPPVLKPLLVALKPEVLRGLPGSAPGWTLANLVDVYTLPQYYEPLLWTLITALLVTLLTTTIGVALAWIVHRTDIRWKLQWELLIVIPFFLSPFSTAIAWIGLGATQTGFLNQLSSSLGLGRLVNIFSLAGVIWVMVTAFVPIAYLTVSGPLKSMDGTLEEVGLMLGASPWRVTLDVTLRLLMPAIIAAAMLVLVLSAEVYSIPGLLGLPGGVKSLPWTAVTLTQNWPAQYGHAAAASTVLLLITLAGIWVYSAWTRRASRFVTITGKGLKPRIIELGRWRHLVAALLGLYVLFSLLLPYATLVVSSLQQFSSQNVTLAQLGLGNYQYVLDSPNLLRAITNTVIVSVVSATAAVLLVLIIAYGVLRSRHRGWHLAEWLVILPIAMPGVIIGYGVLWTYVATPLYGTVILLILINVVRWQSFGIGVTKAGLLQVDPSLEEAARMSGAGAVRAARDVSLPLIIRSVMAAWLFIIVMAVKELAASLLVSSNESTVLAVSTWDLAFAGEFNKAAALAIIQTVVILVVVIVASVIFRIDLRNVGGTPKGAV